MAKKRKRKLLGVYLLPTLLTLLNLGAGFYAVILLIYTLRNPGQPRWTAACWAIVIALFADAFDGMVARMTGTDSVFGVQLDSLADLLSFGLAPALLVYIRWLTDYARLGWIMAFAVVLAAALRLARFNVQASEEENKGFTGLPVPAAASLLISFTFFYDDFRGLFPRYLNDGVVRLALPAVMFGLAYLMFSTVRYPSFKHMNLRRKHPLGVLGLVSIVLYILVLQPYATYFVAALLYLLFPVGRRLLMPHRRVASEIIVEPDDHSR